LCVSPDFYLEVDSYPTRKPGTAREQENKERKRRRATCESAVQALDSSNALGSMKCQLDRKLPVKMSDTPFGVSLLLFAFPFRGRGTASAVEEVHRGKSLYM